MRIVADVNVLISGLLWLGPSHTILQLAEEQKLSLCLSPSISDELCQVLDRQKFLKRIRMCGSSSEELIAGLYKFTILFPDKDIPNVVKDDQDDNKIISCAIACDAQYIVTGDPHLLNVKRYGTITIVTPRKFLTILYHP